MKQQCLALLGRQDEPTDAVEEYCQFLAAALEGEGLSLVLSRVPWNKIGWNEAFKNLKTLASIWTDHWVLIQYTALAWSQKGVPLRFTRLVRLLRKRGVRVAVVFHDTQPYPGTRLVDRIRRALQIQTMRSAVQVSDLTVLTVPPEKATWLYGDSGHKIVFIPVGANLPDPEMAWKSVAGSSRHIPTVAAFSLTGGRLCEFEVKAIVEAMRYVAERIGRLRLAIFGRNVKSAERQLSQGLRGSEVEMELGGILSADEVVKTLGGCDVLLFVRGPISSRRGSAIAGIACGLPVIAEAGWETTAPITEAGVVLTKPGECFGPALFQVLSDMKYRESLVQRSRIAYERYFSWYSIARRFSLALQCSENRTEIEPNTRPS